MQARKQQPKPGCGKRLASALSQLTLHVKAKMGMP
jgi:hypothetical protein